MPRPRDPLARDAVKKPAKRDPFPFVLDELDALAPTTRPMFGCKAVYVGPKIVLILRERTPADDDNGVWVATQFEHHASLRAQLKSLRSITVFGPGESAWQCIPSDGDRFEDEVLRVCAMIRAGDPRVGRVPGAKKKPAPASKQAKPAAKSAKPAAKKKPTAPAKKKPRA